jgi:hypothetical protein
MRRVDGLLCAVQATAPIQITALIAEPSGKNQSQFFAQCCMCGVIAGAWALPASGLHGSGCQRKPSIRKVWQQAQARTMAGTAQTQRHGPDVDRADLAMALVAGLLALAAVFAIIAPQGLTWLPLVLALALAGAMRVGASRSAGLDHVGGVDGRGVWLAGWAAALPWLAFGLWAGFRALTSPMVQAPAVLGSFALAFAGSAIALGLSARIPPHGRWHWGFFPALSLIFALLLELILSGAVSLAALGGPRLASKWHYNRAAVMLALLLPLAIFAIGRMPFARAARVGLGVIVVLASSAVIFRSESESAQLALALIIIVQLVCRIRVAWARWLIILGAAAAILLMPLVMRPLVAWLVETPFWTGRYQSVVERFRLWVGIMPYIEASPWIGNGIEFVRDIGFRDFQSGRQMLHNHPHSFLMQTWVDLGLVGVVLVLWCIHAGTSAAARAASQPAAAMQLSVVAAVLGVWAVSHGMWQAWFVGMSGFAIVFARLLARRAEQEHHPR